MRCPACSGSKFRLGVVFAGEVACTFRDGEVVEILDTASLDSYWTDDSACHCINCDWSGRVKELSAPGRRGVERSPERRSSPLDRIELSVNSGDCPNSIRQELQQLISMTRELEKEVQILEAARRAGRQGRRFEAGDTAIF